MDEEELTQFLASVDCPDLAPAHTIVNTGERLLITHIVTDNFKSYAGRHIIGPFHKNFTSIVGPNGSGKSNVIDSLLFVFGYRAQKIRSKKISVLIHNSDEYPDLNYCTVEVHFVKGVDKNDHEYDPVPGSSFYVSRTAFKDNTSHYSLNGKRVQFKEATNLLRNNGIDLDHNRFLILQGEVEQIALMKPKALQEGDEGMLEYLEDIIGSSRFIPFIEQLNKKCEEVNEIRNEKLNRVKAVEAEKKDLEGSKNEAVAYLLLENEIIKKKNLLLHLNKYEEEKKCANVVEERDALKAEYREHQKALEEVIAQIKIKKDLYENAKKKFDECSSTIDRCKEKFSEMEKEDTKLREDTKHSRKRMKELEAAIEAEKKKLEDLKAQPEKAERQINEIREKIRHLEENMPGLEAKLQESTAKLRDETKDLQVSKEKAEKELVQYQKSVNDARSKMDIAQSELDICLSAQVNENKKLQELQNLLKKATDTTAEHKKLLPSLEENLQKNEITHRNCEKKLREITVEINNCEEAISKKREAVEEARSKLQSSRSRGQVLDAILQQKREGKIQGIIGRLGDLGAIDEKYDVAISTACGPLDNILVDTIDTAQKCVEFLKSSNIGSATFLALDKQNVFINEMRRPFEGPENVPRLFDLIRVEDESVLPAFYYALRDTLVADNLERATRIGMQGRTRYRVVTLDGKLIEVSGTMSGGGNRQMRGRMGRSVIASPSMEEISPEKLKRLDDDLNIQKGRLDELRKRKREFESEIDSCSREIDQLRSRIDKCRSEMERYDGQEKSLKKQIAEQIKVVERTVPDAAEQKRLQKNVEKLTNEYERVKPGESKLQENVESIHKQIMEISEKLVGSAQKQLDACKRELDDYRKGATKASVSAKTATRNVSKTEDKIKSLQEEAEENRKKLENVRERLKELDREGNEVVGVHEQALADFKLFENDSKLAKNELANFEEKEQQLTAASMDKKQRLDHAEKTFKEYNQKKAHWEKEIKKLKLNDLSDLESIGENVNAAAEREADDDNNNDNDNDNDNDAMDADKKNATAETASSESRSSELPVPTVEQLQNVDRTRLTFKLSVDEGQLNTMKPNLAAIAEYRKKMEKFRDCVQQLEKVTIVRDKIRAKYDELKKRRLNEFLTGFEVISSKLKEMYQMITLGGDADLELVDTMDPFSEGVAFSVRPPKKSWKQISNLSGGEKTLSSLALVFALHHYKPTPLYVMDEIDAALDFRNVSIVANYIKERTKDAQFIIISLRSNMFELSDRLVGIYKTYNCTKSVTVDPWKISMGVSPDNMA